MTVRRPRRLAAAAVLALVLAAVGQPSASAAPVPAGGPGVRPFCGDDGCFDFGYQVVRFDQSVTGLGPQGVARSVTWYGEILCDPDWGPDFVGMFLVPGESRTNRGFDVRQQAYREGRCTISYGLSDDGLASSYAVTGPTVLSTTAFDLPPWGTTTDYDHPLLTVTATTPVRAGVVAGRLWSDRDRDGVRDPGERPVGGASVRLDPRGDLADLPATTVTTTADGSYRFPYLAAGEYAVTFPSLPGRRPTGSAGTVRTVAVDPGGAVTGVDQGYVAGRALRPPRDR